MNFYFLAKIVIFFSLISGYTKVPDNRLYKFYYNIFKYNFYSIFIYFLLSKAPHKLQTRNGERESVREIIKT
jgi:hypothetical protein